MIDKNMDKNMDKMISLLKESRVTLPPDFSQKLHNRLAQANQEMLQTTASEKTWLKKLVSIRGVLAGAVCMLVIGTVFITGVFDQADIITPIQPDRGQTDVTNGYPPIVCTEDYPDCSVERRIYYDINGYAQTYVYNDAYCANADDGVNNQVMSVAPGHVPRSSINAPSANVAQNVESLIQESVIIPMPNEANSMVLIPPIQGGVRLPTPREFPAPASVAAPIHDVIAPMAPRYTPAGGGSNEAVAVPGRASAVVVAEADVDAFSDDLLEVEPMTGPIDFGETVIFINAIQVYRLSRNDAAIIFDILGITVYTNQVTISQEDFDRLPRTLMERNFAGTLESRDSVFNGIMHRIEIIEDCAN
ncbi:MAG: hypothetical protein FWE04_05090 [Oscillospiraceae bacterium]|nr:hypothetical protein [Oscillospiraceae bacterium]